MQNLLDDLKEVLAQDGRFVVDGKLLKNKIIEAGLQLDPGLIKLLLQSEQIKAHFFQEVDGVLVFDKVKFQQFVSNKEFLPDSYTAFKNKIGLTANGEFLAESKEVVLSWAYKDCVLEGGQDKEDAKRDEVFWNEVLAPGDIDRLLHPKVLTNWKRYTQEGEEEAKEVSLDDNLILKGNNLLALHSLKKVYMGRVKLIYIDPPYFFREPKQDDSFTYNSNFKLSTWISFMNNRLKVARELLTSDGVIFVSINEDGLAYLKMLMDEIFKIENFIDIFTWKKTDTPSNLPYKSKKSTEYILCYEKVKDNVRYKGLVKTSPSNDPLTKPKNSLKTIVFKAGTLICSEKINIYQPGYYGTDKYPQELLDELVIENFTNKNDVRFKNRFIWEQKNFESEISKGTKIFCSKKSLVLSYKKASYEVEAPFDIIDSSMGIDTAENAGKELSFLFGKEVFKYPKSESLIKYLLNIVSNKLSQGDIVLDFHLGSGTTAAVCHKMGLKYIGIEQLDFHCEIILERLKKVIAGENSGISTDVNWQGGGSFVYAELKKANQSWIDEVMAADSDKALNDLWNRMQQHAFISYKVEPKAISETAKDFESLDIEDKKRFLVEVLDKNALYVNLSDIENQDFQVSEKDKALTKLFYSLK